MRKQIGFLIIALGALALLGGGCVNKNTLPIGSADKQSLPAAISVSNQPLKDGQLTINWASIDDDGWLAIHKKQNGQPEAVVGYTSLFKDKTKTIKIAIDKSNLSPSLIAMLHYDRGEKGIFEFPGADGPIIKNKEVVMKEFNITNYAEITKDLSSPAVASRKEFVIIAKQWSFSPAIIKVKKGDTVVLKLKSADVAHSFVVPEFKIDAAIKPGETKIVEFVADKTGSFTSICGVYCGVGHTGMTGTLIVE